MTQLKPLNKATVGNWLSRPERVVQFGAGNFLRAFVNWIIEDLNEKTNFDASVVIVKVTPRGTYAELDAQDGLFHVHLEGVQAGNAVSETKLITNISRTVYPYLDFDAYLNIATQPEIRFLISNTTESGITYVASDQADAQPPSSFPAKLTRFLYHRYQHFAGASDKGCIVIPTELIEDNGSRLREIVLQYAQQWDYDAGFTVWINQHNLFCNTLVDRIVSGFPEAKSAMLLDTIGYDDKLLVMGEYYHSWIIEAPDSLKRELPVDQTDLNVKIVADAAPYRQTKVLILNGAHSSMVPTGYLLGLEAVRDCIEHEHLSLFLEQLVYQEIIPAMDMPVDELQQFASDTFDRFRNPAIHHRLIAIATNSSTKMNTRIVPSIKGYWYKYQILPLRLVLAFSAFIRFYKGEWNGKPIPLNDDAAVIAWFKAQWSTQDSMIELANAVLQNTTLWNEDLSRIPGLAQQIAQYLTAIDADGMLTLLQAVDQS